MTKDTFDAKISECMELANELEEKNPFESEGDSARVLWLIGLAKELYNLNPETV